MGLRPPAAVRVLYANTREAGPAYERLGYTAADAGQEGYLFFEIDLGDLATRIPHPERGS